MKKNAIPRSHDLTSKEIEEYHQQCKKQLDIIQETKKDMIVEREHIQKWDFENHMQRKHDVEDAQHIYDQ